MIKGNCGPRFTQKRLKLLRKAKQIKTVLARWNAAETYNEVEKLEQVLRWDEKDQGVFIRAHSAHTEHISLCDEEKSAKDPVCR